MRVTKNNGMLETAKKLRKELTPQERKLWYLFLRKYPVKIYKQRIIASYVVDFYCASARLVIEVDGLQHFSQQGIESDKHRTAVLKSFDLEVLRFTNHEVDKEFTAVCETIDFAIKARMKSK